MKLNRIIVLAALALVAVGCSSPRKVLYFQNIDEVKLQELSEAYQAVIKKDDILSIIVTGPDKSVIAPYNFTLTDISISTNSSVNPETTTLGYLVDSNGNIQFPILGSIHVEGMTRNQLSEYLTYEIGKDVKDPIVYVSFRNYKVTVLGEVRNPGTYSMKSEKVNVLQAISEAGDLNLTAKRDNILLLREENGRIAHYTFDLRDAHLLDSPYFFLQQNDILYIPPSTGRVASATNSVGVWTSIVSSITSTLAIVTTVLTLAQKSK